MIEGEPYYVSKTKENLDTYKTKLGELEKECLKILMKNMRILKKKSWLHNLF